MVETTKLQDAFKDWAAPSCGGGADELTKDEFKAALGKADKNGDGKLDSKEFGALAKDMGLSKFDAKTAFENAKGCDGKLGIDDFIEAAETSNKDDSNWTMEEFESFIEKTAESGTDSDVFGNIGDGDSKITKSEMQSLIQYYRIHRNRFQTQRFFQ